MGETERLQNQSKISTSKLQEFLQRKLGNTCGFNSKYGFSETWFDDFIDNNLSILDSDHFVSF